MKRKGFTLIETIVYIALLSFMLGGVFSVAYDLIESSSRQSQSIAVDEELNFLFRKIDWVLSGVSHIDAPRDSRVSDTLTIQKSHFLENPLTITLHDGLLLFSKNYKEAIPLNSESVKIDSASFSYIRPVSGGPAGINVVLQIGNRFATSTYYVR